MYYTIQDNNLLIAETEEALTRYYENVLPLPVDYEKDKYVVVNNELVLNPNYEAEQKAKRQEEIAMFSLTGADVERGIYKAKGMDFDDIIAYVTQLQPEGLDVKALKIELKANNFYRGNPYVDAVGTLLGFTKEQLDKFFETGDYTYLLPTEQVEEETEQVEVANEGL